MPAISIGMNAISEAMNTSVPAAASKSSRYVRGYELDAVTTGTSR